MTLRPIIILDHDHLCISRGQCKGVSSGLRDGAATVPAAQADEVGTVSNDGTKIQANASKHAATRRRTGRFAAMMDVALVNDGPVSIVIESKLRK